MKVLANAAIAAIVAGWLVTVAVLSIQNVRAVSLQFFAWESIRVPFGVLLAIGVGGGCVLGAVVGPTLRSRRRRNDWGE